MNDIITLSQLITRLAKVTGSDPNTARRFLKSFFATIEERLAQGESVTIKNIGTFRRASEDPLEKSAEVVFIPDQVIMEEVNRPFDMFDAVELAPGVEFEAENEVQTSTDTEQEKEVEQHEVAEAPQADAGEPAEEPVSAPKQAISVSENVHIAEYEPQTVEETIIPAPVAPSPKQQEPKLERPVAKADIAPEQNVEEETEEEEEEYDSPRREPKKRSLLWLWISLAVVAALVGGYYAAVYHQPIPDLYGDDEEEPSDSIPSDSVVMTITEVDINTEPGCNKEAAQTSKPTEVATPDTPKAPASATAQAQSQSQKAKVYDTVDVSLIRLAVKHYHEKFFWVYIFEANRDVISNPNTIRPGTRVVIPDRSTFPGATPEEARRIARNKQAEILAKF